MTLHEFRDLLLTADPAAVHYESLKNENYTRWQEFGSRGLIADNQREDVVLRIQVDRFTKIEYDPMKEAIDAVLDQDYISFAYTCDYEKDTGYIHHIWDCEVA